MEEMKMMNNMTKMILTAWLADNLGKIVNKNDIIVNGNKVSWETMNKYIKTESVWERFEVTEEEYESYDAEELSYYGIEEDENGYYGETMVGYKVIGWKVTVG